MLWRLRARLVLAGGYRRMQHHRRRARARGAEAAVRTYRQERPWAHALEVANAVIRDGSIRVSWRKKQIGPPHGGRLLQRHRRFADLGLHHINKKVWLGEKEACFGPLPLHMFGSENTAPLAQYLPFAE